MTKDLIPIVTNLTKEIENQGVQLLIKLWVDYNDIKKSDKKKIDQIIKELSRIKQIE